MQGHEPLIRMRRSGRLPSKFALVDTVDRYTDFSTRWPADSGIPHIEVLTTESPARLDLRFLVGMRVLVSGGNLELIEALSAQCAQYAETTVACHLSDAGDGAWVVTKGHQ